MQRYKFYLLLTFVSEECFVFAAAAALTAAASLFGAYSQYQSSRNAAKQAEYDAEYEAEVSAEQAKQEKMNRAAQEKSERSQSARRRAAQRASYAKSGVLLEGTPLTMLAEQAGVDEQNIQQGNLESRQRQANLKAGGRAALQSGKNKSSAYKAQGTTNLLTGLGKTAISGAQSYNWWDKNGPSSGGGSSQGSGSTGGW